MLQGKTRPGEQDETNARGEKCRNDKNARNYSDEKKNEGLQVMFNEALGRNTQLLNKKQAGGPQELLCKIQDKSSQTLKRKIQNYDYFTMKHWTGGRGTATGEKL